LQDDETRLWQILTDQGTDAGNKLTACGIIATANTFLIGILASETPTTPWWLGVLWWSAFLLVALAFLGLLYAVFSFRQVGEGMRRLEHLVPNRPIFFLLLIQQFRNGHIHRGNSTLKCSTCLFATGFVLTLVVIGLN